MFGDLFSHSLELDAGLRAFKPPDSGQLAIRFPRCSFSSIFILAVLKTSIYPLPYRAFLLALLIPYCLTEKNLRFESRLDVVYLNPWPTNLSTHS